MLSSRFAGVLAASAAIFFCAAASAWAAAPVIEAESSGSVNATAATLTAQINPNGEETAYQYEYSTQATGETLEGTITKVEGAGPLSGSENQGVETRVEALKAQTQYFWRVVATNAASETTTGTVETFTTALPPEAPTIEPVELEGTTAKLKGVLNPNNTAEIGSSYEFLYRLSATECQGEGETSTGQAAEAGVQGEQVSAEATLQPNATYAFCLLARNQVGETAVSSVATVTTPAAPPAVDAEGSTGVTSAAATLTAQINPNNQETTYTFEYSTQATGETLEGTIIEVAGAAPLSGFGDQAVEAKLESLPPRTQYFYRVVATNASAEKTIGKVETFSTLDAPLVTTGAALGITPHKSLDRRDSQPRWLGHQVSLRLRRSRPLQPGCRRMPAGGCVQVRRRGQNDPERTAWRDRLHRTRRRPAGPRRTQARHDLPLRARREQLVRRPRRIRPDVHDIAGDAAKREHRRSDRGDPALGDAHRHRRHARPAGNAVVPSRAQPRRRLAGAGCCQRLAVRHKRDDHVLVRPLPAAGHDLLLPCVRCQRRRQRSRRMALLHDYDLPVPVRGRASFDTAAARSSEAEEKPSKPLTNAQKLAKALKVCHKDKKKSKRAQCERAARGKYGPRRKK